MVCISLMVSGRTLPYVSGRRKHSSPPQTARLPIIMYGRNLYNFPERTMRSCGSLPRFETLKVTSKTRK